MVIKESAEQDMLVDDRVDELVQQGCSISLGYIMSNCYGLLPQVSPTNN